MYSKVLSMIPNLSYHLLAFRQDVETTYQVPLSVQVLREEASAFCWVLALYLRYVVAFNWSNFLFVALEQ